MAIKPAGFDTRWYSICTILRVPKQLRWNPLESYSIVKGSFEGNSGDVIQSRSMSDPSLTGGLDYSKI